MKKELKQEIINFIFDNENEVQLHNATLNNFKSYIYNAEGGYIIGGEDVSEFIDKAIKLITA